MLGSVAVRVNFTLLYILLLFQFLDATAVLRGIGKTFFKILSAATVQYIVQIVP